jgi:elongation factor Ts
MAEITAGLVKELRQSTGAGMMDCKKALVETGGDVEAAVDWLRKRGLAAAAKKAGRAASEGLVGAVVDGRRGALVEVNAETDFVARNDVFQEFVRRVSQLALDAGGGIERLNAAEYPGSGRSVAEEATHLVAMIGENILVRRTAALSVETGAIAAYVHNQAAPGVGKIGVLVALESEGDGERVAAFGKQLAMHVAASAPQFLSVGDVDPAQLEREREVLAAQARESGKPEEIVAKMVEGRLRKYYDEVVLLEQTYVIDGENKVAKAVDLMSKELGATVRIGGLARFALGEGVTKAEGDFAAEVARLTG